MSRTRHAIGFCYWSRKFVYLKEDAKRFAQGVKGNAYLCKKCNGWHVSEKGNMKKKKG